jgi:polyisoprenoid-binding protein YceI
MKTFFILFLSLFTIKASSQRFQPVDEGSKVHFTIKNFGIGTGGQLSGLQGSIIFDAKNLALSKFNVSVAVKTIDTDSKSRDEHLRESEFFDEEKYPLITIVSAKITKSGSGYNFSGTLTMHGITKSISFPFTVASKGNDLLFTGDLKLNRLDYGVGESSSVLSNTVKVSLSVLAKKP